ncbi:MAG: glycosyltransferase family 4 protein [Planctomycetaceae bacterium]|jgi:glycosyltransferase involved in cell wall biosynthesis|nr:glycosyltransferase family 4 protein [Planctomycetaceae bacterium]
MDNANHRILIPINNPLGGIKTYTLSYIRYLREEGFRFTILAPENNIFDQFQNEAKIFPDVEFIAVPDGSRFMKMVLAIRKTLKTKRFHLTHSQGLKAGFQTSVAGWGLHIPQIVTLHDVIVPQNDMPGKGKWLKKRTTGFFTRYVNEIVPVSEDCAANHLKHFPEWKKGPCRITPILNGIDLDKFPATGLSDNSLRKQFQFSDEMILLGFFGRFMPQKGFLPLLDAMEILAARGYSERVRLIAAKDKDGYLSYFSAAQRNDVLRQMVRLIEPQNNIAALISQMNLVLMPSLWEACSLVSMEAMLMGVPFLGSRCLGIREVLRDTPCRMCTPDDPASIADEIEYYVKHTWDEEAKKFAATARRRFDVRNGIKQMSEIYRKFV